MSQHWSNYWEQGHTTSFGGELDNYDGALGQVWARVSKLLPNNFKLLDLCTGNGAVPLLITEHLNHEFMGEIFGIDYAKVSLRKPVINDRITIELLSNKTTESIPFEAETFDLCTSQFGVEYTKLPKTVSEIARVLKPQGKVALVMHHRHSRLIKLNEQILSFIKSPLFEDLFELLKALVIAKGEIKTSQDISRIKADEKCERLRQQVNVSIKTLVNIDEDMAKSSELLFQLGQVFTSGIYWPVSNKLKLIEHVAEERQTSIERLNELIKSALDERDLEDLAIICNENRLDLVGSSVVRDEDIIAWYVELLKQS
ncbi:class I SAM-dependent methyltransferase [Shewanella maritima]|uniref:class I SAM-dependent methyltransferase n=1 Tax=Shewanella maritima TaxID=2520507 RepID=UPI00373604D5